MKNAKHTRLPINTPLLRRSAEENAIEREDREARRTIRLAITLVIATMVACAWAVIRG